MKTAEQIEEWLKSQKWYKSFKRNCIRYNSKEGAEDILKGKYGRSTIVAAFRWSEFPYRGKNGIHVWSDISVEFKEWFNS